MEALKLLIVKIYKGDHTPYTYQQKAFMRRDTPLVAFSDRTVNRIKDRTTLESCSLLKQFDECMSLILAKS